MFDFPEGKLNPSQKIHFRPWDEITQKVGSKVQSGGYYKPDDCMARVRVAIVIPFRDRELHLRSLMLHIHPILQRQLLEYRIFVVEQVSESRPYKSIIYIIKNATV